MSILEPASFNDHLSEFKNALESYSIETDNSKLSQLELFCQKLIEYNSHTNLVADSSFEALFRRHILDSLTILEFPRLFDPASDNKPFQAIDLGTGAGFPGICLAIWKPEISVVLVDSNSKKTKFLKDVIKALDLEDRVFVETERLEVIGHQKQHRGVYDLVTSRALGHLLLCAEVGLPLMQVGGAGVFYKTALQAKAEKPFLAKPKESMGGGRIKILRPKIQMGHQEHVLVRILKASKGSDSFPRSWQKIKRQINRISQPES